MTKYAFLERHIYDNPVVFTVCHGISIGGVPGPLVAPLAALTTTVIHFITRVKVETPSPFHVP